MVRDLLRANASCLIDCVRLAYLADRNEKSATGRGKGGRRVRTAHDLAGEAFLELLKRLRKTFLQDAVQWRVRHPRNWLWDHQLFDDPEFLDFEERALIASSLSATSMPHDIRTALPRLCDLLDQSSQASAQTLRDTSTTLSNHGEALRQVLERVTSLDGSYKAIRAALSEPRSITVSLPAVLASTGNEESASPSIQLTDPDREPMPPIPTGHSNAGRSGSPSGPSHRLIAPYSMSRAVHTVIDLWREYSVGLSGTPAMKTMYETGKHHFTSDTERRWYRRRKTILNLVDEVAQQRDIPGVEAAASVEAWRTRQSGMTLNKLSDTVTKMSSEERLLLVSPDGST